MDPAVLGVFIPILAIGLGIPLGFYGVWTSNKQKMAKLEVERLKAQADSHGRTSEQSAQIAELEDRMRVLERIVTDRGFDVAHQIEALRDRRPVEDLIEDRTQAQ
jgi:hypothetical protein